MKEYIKPVVIKLDIAKTKSGGIQATGENETYSPPS